MIKKYNFQHQKADIEGLTEDEINSLDIFCTMACNSTGFPVFINYMLNTHVADTIGGNVALFKEGRTPVTDEKFMGGAQKIVEIQDFILSR